MTEQAKPIDIANRIIAMAIKITNSCMAPTVITRNCGLRHVARCVVRIARKCPQAYRLLDSLASLRLTRLISR
jgi:hypothetical protein